jgi:opacity protein-like surface antigen
MRKTLIAVGAVLALTAGASRADAQTTFITPFVGAAFGGDAPDTRLTTGASISFLGTFAGFEAELGYTPDFFGESDDLVLVGDNNMMTLMANLLVGGGPSGNPVRPYGVIGAGLLRSRVDGGDLFDDVSENDFGFNAGAGVIVMLSNNVGVRGDLRYFRNLQGDEEDDGDVEIAVGDFDFWRVYGGVTFGF